MGELLCPKTELPRLRRGLHSATRASLPQLPRKAGDLLGATLLCFESFLRPLRCTLKPGGSHLRRGAALLLQDVALQFLFGYRLTATTKGSGLYGSRTYILLSKVALTTDISKGLVDGSVIELTHKGRCGSRVESPCCASERANTLLCGSQTKSAGGHKTLLRCGGRRTCAIGGLLEISLARPRGT